MNIKRILHYLAEIAANNNRDWFQTHKKEYLWCREEFEEGVTEAIATIAEFDPTIAHVTAKDACFRFNRDTRFSPDKSPYKRHFGAYISAKGRKSLHAGYYIHLQPGHCLLSAGAYWLPTPILTSCRNEIMGHIDTWRECVENGKFVNYFGYANEGVWNDEQASQKGFGISCLKTCPKGFPSDYEFIEYLRMKDYACWHRVDDDFFAGNDWLLPMAELFKVALPMMQFTNNVIDDYE